MGDDQPARLWSFWRDKKGLGHALTAYYGSTLEQMPTLQVALMMIRMAEREIDATMLELAKSHPDYDDALDGRPMR